MKSGRCNERNNSIETEHSKIDYRVPCTFRRVISMGDHWLAYFLTHRFPEVDIIRAPVNNPSSNTFVHNRASCTRSAFMITSALWCSFTTRSTHNLSHPGSRIQAVLIKRNDTCSFRWIIFGKFLKSCTEIIDLENNEEVDFVAKNPIRVVSPDRCLRYHRRIKRVFSLARCFPLLKITASGI